MSNEDDKAHVDKLLDYDCSWASAGIGRFRVNIMKQRGSFAIIMRVIPWEVPTFQKLGLPEVMAKVAEAERGMILVTGVTGSGKSSTMAALINHINQRDARHILTLENPIEFLHKDSKSSVTQREVGSDTIDFKMGLRAALRQDPDVIMIGEMRDGETVDTAIKAAETGHLLMSTLHTPDAQSTILRIMAMFPPEEQDVIRVRLAESLYAVISQRLLPRASGKGRAVAAEVMINTPAIKDIILEGTRIGEIRDFIAEGREQYGMQTFDQCLADLVASKEVTFDTAKAAASNPSDFELKMRMFSQTPVEEPGVAVPAPEESAPPPAAAEAPTMEGMQTGGLDFLGQ
jgi:twitching motility protein PilT